jgi:hypothetical protein
MTEDIASPENPGPLLRVVKHQPIAFAIVGVANTAIGYGLFVIWTLILDNKDLYQVAVIGAYSISVLIAFVLHRTLVFRVRGHVARDLGAFIVVNSGGLVLNLSLSGTRQPDPSPRVGLTPPPTQGEVSPWESRMRFEKSSTPSLNSPPKRSVSR